MAFAPTIKPGMNVQFLRAGRVPTWGIVTKVTPMGFRVRYEVLDPWGKNPREKEQFVRHHNILEYSGG